MQALVIAGPGRMELKEVELPSVGPGEALVKLQAVALNRRDYWIGQGKYPNIRWGSILGSDGCGVVEQVQDQNDRHWVGQEVVVYPGLNWGANSKVQSTDYQVLGMPTNGTFAEYMSIPVSSLQPKPAYLSPTSAAAIPLAGLTAYRSLFTQGSIMSGQQVLITGIGGGVSQMALLLALSADAKVFVTSSSEEKIKKAKTSGAIDGFNYKTEDWSKVAIKETGGFDLIIDSTGGEGFNDLVRITKPAGRIVFYGATNGPAKSLDLFRVFWNQIHLQGSTMGSEQEFASMLDRFEEYQLNPVIDSIRPFDQINDALARMENGDQTGKLVMEF